MAEQTVTIRLLGGLGNQMFQYATALALAQRHGGKVLLDTSAFETYKVWPYLLDQLNVPQDKAPTPVPATGNRLRDRILRRLTGRAPKQAGFYTEPHFHFDPAVVTLRPPAKLDGYFQSALYFEDAGDAVRAAFTLKNPLSTVSAQYAAQITAAATPVSLHVRRGDYITNKSALATHGTASLDYYRQAVTLMNALHGGNVTYFIFSDDPDYVEENFGFCPQRVIVRGAADLPYEDIHLMTLCHHHIIANSSFSWWGAWLNPRADKTVIAPRQWFARAKMLDANTMDIYPQGWILL